MYSSQLISKVAITAANNPQEYKKHSVRLHQAELNAEGENSDERIRELRSDLSKTERTLKQQAAIAFQRLELDLVKQNMTAEELNARKRDAKAMGEFEQKLKDAADAARTEAEQQADEVDPGIEPDDLRDVRDGNGAQPMAEGEQENVLAEAQLTPIQVNGMSADRGTESHGAADPSVEKKAIAAAGKLCLELLVGQESTDRSAKFNCMSCMADETVPEELPEDLPPKSRNTQYQNKLYNRSDLQKHLAGDFHSPKMKWFRKHVPHDQPINCPYDPEFNDCKINAKPKDILNHVLRGTTQSDEHLLLAAADGIFFRDFDATEDREKGSVQGKGKRGEGLAFKAYGDPDEFEVEAFVPPGNITDEGVVEEDDSVTPYKKPIRLPPNAELLSSTLYHEHPEGIHGRVADVLQAQRGFLARRAEDILRQHETEQNQKGETKQKATSGKGKRKVAGLAKLRDRLTKLNFDWGGNLDGEGDDGADEAGGPEDGQPGPAGAAEEDDGDGGEQEDDDMSD